MSVKSNYPNFVLGKGRNDYIDTCSFSVDVVKKSIIDDDLVCSVKYVLVSKFLEHLVKERIASIVILIKCNSTNFIRCFSFEEGALNQTIKINKYDVANKVDVIGVIVANQRIDEFTGEGEFNPLWYDGESLPAVAKGDILAIDDENFIELDAELKKPIHSFFYIKGCEDNEIKNKNILPDFNQDKIIIMVSKKTYKLYCNLMKERDASLDKLISSVLILPVLAEAISYVKAGIRIDHDDCYDDYGYSNKKWFRAIRLQCGEKGIDLEDDDVSISTAANMLFNDCALVSLEKILSFLDGDLSEEIESIMGD